VSGIRRRDFLLLGGGAAAAPSLLWRRVARAEQPGTMRHVGVLMGYAEEEPEAKARLAGFRQGLEKLGWWEGRNIRIDYRYSSAATVEQVQELAKELVALQPEVIFAPGTLIAAAVQRETRVIPVVFVNVSDPIGSGFIASLARPGGNLTGLLLYEATITGKWLAMLKEMAPNVTRAALVANPKTTAYAHFLRAAAALAPALTIEVVPGSIENAADLERSIGLFAVVPNGGLVVLPDFMTTIHRDLIIALAARHRLPAVYYARFFVAAGGLMSYGVHFVDMFRQAASFVDRILRGDKPADLPVQTPTRFETILNLKTARALGLPVPPGLLVAADEVIE
jgi:putative tryptophan/tyrosine transport system substrate-binding protein